jgi:hypothetical protein
VEPAARVPDGSRATVACAKPEPEFNVDMSTGRRSSKTAKPSFPRRNAAALVAGAKGRTIACSPSIAVAEIATGPGPFGAVGS